MQNHTSTTRASSGLDPTYAFIPFPELGQCPCIAQLLARWAGSAWEKLSLAVFPLLECEEVLLRPCEGPITPPLWRLTAIRTGPRTIRDLQLAGEHRAGEGGLCTQCPKSQCSHFAQQNVVSLGCLQFCKLLWYLLAGSFRKDLSGCAWKTSEQQYTSIKCLSEGLVR